jgi:hypothetical protein
MRETISRTRIWTGRVGIRRSAQKHEGCGVVARPGKRCPKNVVKGVARVILMQVIEKAAK